MRIDIVTLFPELCDSFLSASILGRARAKNLFEASFIPFSVLLIPLFVFSLTRFSVPAAGLLPLLKEVGAYHPKRDTTRPVCCPCPGVL